MNIKSVIIFIFLCFHILFGEFLWAQSSSEIEIAILPVTELSPQAIKLVREAKHEIILALESPDFSRTEDNFIYRLVNELILQFRRGLNVWAFIHEPESDQSENNVAEQLSQYLYENGIPVYAPKDKKEVQCNVLILDGFTVLFSSMPWDGKNLGQNQGLVFWCEGEGFSKKLSKLFTRDRHV